MIEKTKHKCLRCGYEWEGKANAKACPACKSYRFREEKRDKEENKAIC